MDLVHYTPFLKNYCPGARCTPSSSDDVNVTFVTSRAGSEIEISIFANFGMGTPGPTSVHYLLFRTILHLTGRSSATRRNGIVRQTPYHFVDIISEAIDGRRRRFNSHIVVPSLLCARVSFPSIYYFNDPSAPSSRTGKKELSIVNEKDRNIHITNHELSYLTYVHHVHRHFWLVRHDQSRFDCCFSFFVLAVCCAEP